ncbi:peroxisomal leader peptide-processing protease-like isoform X2 [Danaus plexippus]|uniref:Peroxisomal leader peptide-processing protease n=2 Tax=Danaus plexippus TaxID=13037 RepID=A0A212F3V1_DANPL|nr:peroxisomal leader peptide-processing protease-like isoform X2 [Danaus plexippus]XP_032519608.1 peroxisomal leader peptide-processing protease-like isoform X2 [Danaus plexippus]XP_032519609.1 peroxisomal leader peptide-processing protease-like isoform X2 [Danaus plexippus]OWR48404.1 peroxisomal leader peptide-processing protease like protein [Danaus plexippus plexippus]
MTVEGVMVSYNYSDDAEHANILTVSASGIKFSKRWVLTHGSILSPLKQANVIKNARGKPILNDEFYDNLPEIYVTCEKVKSKTPNMYENLEILSRERSLNNDADLEHSSYQVRVLTGRICHVWQCPVLDRCVDNILYSWTIGHRDGDVEKQTQLGKALLSVFVLVDLETDNRDFKILRPLSELLDMCQPPPDRGATVDIHSTPFGCEVFLNAVTRGSVCGVVGKRPSLLLTDAATALGSEGGPVFTAGPDNHLVGAVVCSVSWWRGEWVGLTLAAPLKSVLAAKLRVQQPLPARTPPSPLYVRILELVDRSTVLVRCGAAWGAGLYLGGGHVLTCAHVVKHHASHKVSVYCDNVKETAAVRYKTKDDLAYDLALLYVSPAHWRHLLPAVFAEESAQKGESVLAAGFPYFNETNLEELKPTVTSGHVNNVSPSLIQTTCCVQSGFSGGPIFRITKELKVEVLGTIVSNAKTETGASYPYINMAVPTKAFIRLVQHFILERDENVLSQIENKKDMIQSQWRLLPYRSKI